ncbi:hypothetical protein QEH52_18610 [Coraliomargarita sp. SDUM461003]|uniref:Lipoprotein n=1 Tax=Thalassobacterium maritimum TaxID=3041265 RepID=A0ABU1B1H5_9BACT|nr:hypothetical protein [Coraliomargarita sp. SDUM461003]MDQ8209544.1 hypothetical protein [Coraliomargarita sp. SDUM461003]
MKKEKTIKSPLTLLFLMAAIFMTGCKKNYAGLYEDDTGNYTKITLDLRDDGEAIARIKIVEKSNQEVAELHRVLANTVKESQELSDAKWELKNDFIIVTGKFNSGKEAVLKFAPQKNGDLITNDWLIKGGIRLVQK